ncbi:MAG: methylated-DNA--[protein]-cysteine S-methyltransferase [Chitinophagales bacterium]|nr:methylated-DNA--[protein]-cysteine S-methyltransferase [Chitinophagales bacterium]
MFSSCVPSPAGYFVAESDGKSLSRCYFSDTAPVGVSDPFTEQAAHWFRLYLTDPGTPLPYFELPAASDFSKLVWRALLRIPPGGSTTYLSLARQLGGNQYSRAVGAAVGANPLLVLIPCHRVIGSDGSLTGYAGGIHRKEWLLAHEGLISGVQPSLFPGS